MSKNQVIFPLDFYLGHVFDLNVKTADYNSTETMEHMYVGFMYVMYVLITVAFFFFLWSLDQTREMHLTKFAGSYFVVPQTTYKLGVVVVRVCMCLCVFNF